MLLAFATIKRELGIDVDDLDEDHSITRKLRNVCSRIRQQTGRKICWVADNFSVASGGTALSFRCVGHGLSSGAAIKITSSETTSSIDGTYTVTRLSQDTLRITLGTAIAAGDIEDWNDVGRTASAILHPTLTVECRPTTVKDMWIPQSALPWHELTAVDRWDGDSWESVSADDWDTQFDVEPAKAGRVVAVGTWDVPMRLIPGRLGLRDRSTDRNYRLTYRAGFTEVPGDIEQAALSLLCDLMELEGGGTDRQSESHEGSSITRMSADERRQHYLSPDNVIANWRVR
jgi:hypothetical protein